MCRYVRPQNVSGQDYTSTIRVTAPALLALGVVPVYTMERGPCLALDMNP